MRQGEASKYEVRSWALKACGLVERDDMVHHAKGFSTSRVTTAFHETVYSWEVLNGSWVEESVGEVTDRG